MKTITELLAELGDAPDAIAAALRDRGVVGCREYCRRCPIAVYLQRNGIREASVTHSIADGWENGRFKTVTMPIQVRRFVMNMDRGEYPDLEVIDHATV